MTNNSLPFELLEKIFKTSYEGTYSRWHYLCNYALVCRKWAVVANSLLWGETDLYNLYNIKEFQMYKHLTKPGTVCGKYIRKLNMDGVLLWPICIVKMLQACPNIQELSIIDYQYYGGKGDVRDLLSEILHILPNLRMIDIRYSRYFKNRNAIEKLIETRKNLEIRVTWQM
ncbi:hypothetical protein RIR_jg11886.t1 [Rhizophagus irregularis DAOM 181602=DAOM 197198]|nr:hypothetical protein RIR_jg11886.t1 [Rhizophagus irregularis DAOM 181602=DAOM 197198]